MSIFLVILKLKLTTCNRLDDYLRRKAKLQRVEEEVSRRVVVNFFDTVYVNYQSLVCTLT